MTLGISALGLQRRNLAYSSKFYQNFPKCLINWTNLHKYDYHAFINTVIDIVIINLKSSNEFLLGKMVPGETFNLQLKRI